MREPLNEFDQILIPSGSGTYESYPLAHLARKMWRASSNFGLAPLHFLEQRGPFQDGSSPLGMRYDTRTIQILIGDQQGCRTEHWDRRWDILDLLRPNRAFGLDGTITPHVYRKWLPNGKIQRGIDGAITAADNTLTSHGGRFIHWGLEVGQALTVSTATAGADNDTWYVLTCPNDYTVTLGDAAGAAHNFANTETVHWEYTRGWGKRDLYCLLEQGPTFNDGPDGQPYYPSGFREALRFVAHDPFWYGLEQTETWVLLDAPADLVFDGSGAYLGDGALVDGRWLFATAYVGESATIVYWGTRFAKPTITITGPAIDPIISNTTIDATLTMNYTIAAGEVVTINTLNQTAANAAGTNLMPYLSGDLADFGLYPDPQAPNRNNTVHISFGGAVAGVSAAILTWANRYIGI